MEKITGKDLSALKIDRGLASCLLYEELFAFSQGDLIALVLRDKTDNDYSTVLLNKDPDGKYRAIDMSTDHRTVEDAEKKSRSYFAAQSN